MPYQAPQSRQLCPKSNYQGTTVSGQSGQYRTMRGKCQLSGDYLWTANNRSGTGWQGYSREKKRQ